MINKKNIWKIIIFLSIVGIGLAFYLFYTYLTKPATTFCYVNAKVNCDAVTKGPISTLFGIPVSLVGLVGYVVILISTLLKNKRLVLGMAAFGMLFCLYITYKEILILKVICPVCLACQTDMLLLFLLGLKLNCCLKDSVKKSD